MSDKAPRQVSEWVETLQVVLADPARGSAEDISSPSTPARRANPEAEDYEKFVSALRASTGTSVELTNELIDNLTQPVRHALREQARLADMDRSR